MVLNTHSTTYFFVLFLHRHLLQISVDKLFSQYSVKHD